MKRLLCVAGLLGVLAVGVMIVAVQSGCETAEGTDGLTITPDSITMTESNLIQWFEVASASNASHAVSPLPIEWSVTDPSLGNITQSSGYTALYERTSKNGNNTIIARDQYKNEGYAAVKQIAFQYILTMTASPNPIPAGTNRTTITVSGGVAPYEWWVANVGKGTIISGGNSDTAVYKSSQAGANVVHASDANGVLGTINITQQ